MADIKKALLEYLKNKTSYKDLGNIILNYTNKNIYYLVIGAIIGALLFATAFLYTPHGLAGTRKLPTVSALWESHERKICNIDTLHAFLNGYFYNEKVRPDKYRPDSNSVYTSLSLQSQSSDNCASDAGLYAQGYINLIKDRPDSALVKFMKVRNQNIKYLNNSIGLIYMSMFNVDTAEIFFNREIALKGDIVAAVNNLFLLYIENYKYDKLNTLISNPALFKYLADDIKIKYAIRHFNPILYFTTAFNQRVLKVPLRIVVVSFLVVLVWIFYLLLLDTKTWHVKRRILVLFTLGFLSSFICLYIYEVIQIFGKWDMDDTFINDFLYCIFAIGCNEEFIKLLPVLAILLFTKWVKEPYEIIMLVCASALGFAYVENLGYFKAEHFGTVFSRAVYSVVSHLIYSSIAVYGYILAKYKLKNSKLILPYFLASYFIAAFIHGLADYILIDQEEIYLIAMVMFVVLISVWVSILSNALNNSPGFNKSFIAKSDTLKSYLLGSMVLVLILDFLKSSYTYGNGDAIEELFDLSNISIYVIVGSLVYNLSRLHIAEGQWLSLKFYSLDIDNNDVVNLSVRISGYPNNHFLDNVLPLYGKIDKILRTSKKDNEWWHLTLDKPFVYEHFKVDHLMLKQKDETASLIDDKRILCLVQIPIKEPSKTEAGHFSVDDYVFPGWVVIDIEETN